MTEAKAFEELPPIERRPKPESREVQVLRARLLRVPGKFLVAAYTLDRTEAHNLTRRLRRAGGLKVSMRRMRSGTYAVLARALLEIPQDVPPLGRQDV